MQHCEDAYGELELRLGPIAGSIEEYGRGRNAMIQTMLERAGFTASERARIDGAQIPSLEFGWMPGGHEESR